MPSARFDLRVAALDDVSALRENWRESFGDTDDYLDFFFTQRFVPDTTLVAETHGRVVSQLFLLPAHLRTQDDILSADYLFAAATHPDFRGHGIMGALLKKANDFCFSRGKDAIALLPGSRRLYDYYEQFGYETAFFRRRMTVLREELMRQAVPVRQTQDSVSVIRSILSSRDGLLWDAPAIRYALDEHRSFRGAYASSAHAFVSISDDEAVCLSRPDHFGECAALLLELSDLPQFTLLMPSDVPLGIRENGGMIYNLTNKPVNLQDAFIPFAME